MQTNVGTPAHTQTLIDTATVYTHQKENQTQKSLPANLCRQAPGETPDHKRAPGGNGLVAGHEHTKDGSQHRKDYGAWHESVKSNAKCPWCLQDADRRGGCEPGCIHAGRHKVEGVQAQGFPEAPLTGRPCGIKP
jgi:hypothetical protein